MIEGLARMGCGGCGGAKFSVYQPTKMFDVTEVLYVQCLKCKSVSIVRPAKPCIKIDWGEKSEGILARMLVNDVPEDE